MRRKGLTIEVMYTCDGCGLKDRKVNVSARKPSEDVMEWLCGVMRTELTADHNNMSPKCPAVKMAQVMIPVNKPTETARIGEPIKTKEETDTVN